MTTRQVLPTDESLTNGRPIARAFIAQKEEEFAQIVANLLGMLDNIIFSKESTDGAKINATKEMRLLIDVQVKVLAEIERRQDAQKMENKSKNLRQMVSDDPVKALNFIDNEIKKLTEFRGWVFNLANNPIIMDNKASGPFKQLPDLLDKDPF